MKEPVTIRVTRIIRPRLSSFNSVIPERSGCTVVELKIVIRAGGKWSCYSIPFTDGEVQNAPRIDQAPGFLGQSHCSR